MSIPDIEERIESIRRNLDVGDEAGKIFNQIFESKITYIRKNYLIRDEQIQLIKSSVERWNNWWKDMFIKHIKDKHYNSDFIIQIMSLSLIQLKDVNFSNCNLNGVILKYTDLKGCDFSYSDLSFADLEFSYLTNVKFNYANLQHTKISCSSMENTDLGHCDLRNNNSAIYITNRNSIKLDNMQFDSRIVFYDSEIVPYILGKINNKVELIVYDYENKAYKEINGNNRNW